MSAPNPLATPAPPQAAAAVATISSKTYPIAGILTTVYGLAELPPSTTTAPGSSSTHVTCLWLLHPRLQTSEAMAPVAARVIQDWNLRQKSSRGSQKGGKTNGLIAVSFDQRNHGSRLIDALANEAWRHGNERHAQDMFGIYRGTAVDVGVLMDCLGGYVCVPVINTSTIGAGATATAAAAAVPGGKEEAAGPGEALVIERHFVMGVSLGGHAAWQLVFREPRVEAAVVVVGCPDYMRLMSDRARLSKLQSYTSSNGAAFLGSKDFPAALVASVRKWDPKGLLFGIGDIDLNPSAGEQSRLRPILDSTIKGKSILVCSGGADKLVPYRASAPFMEFLKKTTKGWYGDGNFYVEDNVYDGVGHFYSEQMAVDVSRFLCDMMEGKDSRSRDKASRF